MIAFCQQKYWDNLKYSSSGKCGKWANNSDAASNHFSMNIFLVRKFCVVYFLLTDVCSLLYLLTSAYPKTSKTTSKSEQPFYQKSEQSCSLSGVVAHIICRRRAKISALLTKLCYFYVVCQNLLISCWNGCSLRPNYLLSYRVTEFQLFRLRKIYCLLADISSLFHLLTTFCSRKTQTLIVSILTLGVLGQCDALTCNFNTCWQNIGQKKCLPTACAKTAANLIKRW